LAATPAVPHDQLPSLAVAPAHHQLLLPLHRLGLLVVLLPLLLLWHLLHPAAAVPAAAPLADFEQAHSQG
jgi:hypothetical protein